MRDPQPQTPPSFADIEPLIRNLHRVHHLRYRRLWEYYRNPLRPEAPVAGGSDRPYRQGQEWGLPERITGRRGSTLDAAGRKEVVIENDIGWRIDTMVDFLFGKPLVIESTAPDPSRRPAIASLLGQILQRHGGVEFLQQMALLGAVYGMVDVLVKFDPCDESSPERKAARVNASAAAADAKTPAASSAAGHANHVGARTSAYATAAGNASQSRDDATGATAGTGGRTINASKSTVDAAANTVNAFADSAAHSTDAASTEPGGRGSAGPRVSGSDPGAGNCPREALRGLARHVRLEIVEPVRALPWLDARDATRVCGYVQTWAFSVDANARRGSRVVAKASSDASGSASPAGRSGWFQRMLRNLDPRAYGVGGDDARDVRSASWMSAAMSGDITSAMLGGTAIADGRSGPGGLTASDADGSGDRSTVSVVDLLLPDSWSRFQDGVLVSHGRNTLGRIPLVHVQNVAVPFAYAGGSDVEPLIPLQDELNTRLSDRAHRISLQSFRMYLGRGIDGFLSAPVGPGQMWSTDNENASVSEFGGDAACPSEESHLSDLREAMDKCSGVTPIAAGAIKGRIGRLTSAAALRITMQALLARTEKKRTTYGRAIERICELSLAWLDHAGLFPTTPEERGIRIHWPSPLPVNELEMLQQAEAKLRIGVPRQIVLTELGYRSVPAGPGDDTADAPASSDKGPGVGAQTGPNASADAPASNASGELADPAWADSGGAPPAASGDSSAGMGGAYEPGALGFDPADATPVSTTI